MARLLQLQIVLAVFQMLVLGQHAGTWVEEVHPRLDTWICSAAGCVVQNTSVVLEGLYRNFHVKERPDKCLDNHLALVPDYCFDEETCANNCRLEGGNYTEWGVSTVKGGTSLKLDLYVNKIEKHPRVYLFDEDTGNYTMINLIGREFSFEVDMSHTACNLGATMYLVMMPPDGGKSQYNSVGAAYGTGYCDFFCPKKALLNGTANPKGNGACCAEVDVWEANTGRTHMGYLKINKPGVQICSTVEECSVYQDAGCNFNTDVAFYGWKETLDVSQPMTVVTQFHSARSEAKSGNIGGVGDQLLSIQRIYVQNGTIISTYNGQPMTISSCPEMRGNIAEMGNVIQQGMALAFSIFYSLNFYGNGDGKQCWHYALENATVQFADIRWGDIGTTFNADGSDMVLPGRA